MRVVTGVDGSLMGGVWGGRQSDGWGHWGGSVFRYKW